MMHGPLDAFGQELDVMETSTARLDSAEILSNVMEQEESHRHLSLNSP
ncbi:hypothetical protein L3Y34_004451 [Caenorhabditis briggsae]|uniref:Uncharacterized protein n=1 Tax=Caenorhabditis briggsae TaxID=6238 RepID=A0AAE9ABN3_CAEBR|nr:hypothetical protein L3Y34_004451 [Caenorhabditis briggsae]